MSHFLRRSLAAHGAAPPVIDALPFNTELAAGTLSRERFQGYIVQDALYLAQYSRILAIAGARGP